MTKFILLAGAAALASTGPLAAHPGNGNGHAKGKGHAHHATMKHGGGRSIGNRWIVSRDRHGRLYALDARGSCPPGLAKRNNGCTPPGQAKKQYNIGQRYNRNFGNLWTYNQIPNSLRTQYSLRQSERYYYNNGYLYQVDPRSMLVQQVISAILR